MGDIPIQVGDPDEARQAVAGLISQKVDFVTIYVDDAMGRAPNMGPDIYTAIIDEAHKSNLKVFAEVFYLADAKGLVNANVDGLLAGVRDRAVDDELVTMMKEKNTYLTPTLTALEAKFVYADRPDWLGEQLMREAYPAQLSAYLADTVVQNRFRRNPDLARLRQQYSTATANLKKMADGGVKIAFGTGSGSPDTYPGYFEHRELGLMVAAGMSPLDAIKSATSVAAEAIGASEIGTLAAGKNADFIILARNPLDEIAATQQIDYIYRNGKEVARLPMIQNIQIEVPRVTEDDRAQDRAAQAKAAAEAREAAREHFGKYTLGTSQTVRGLPVPTPTGSTSSVQAGAPTRITVSMRGASAADLTGFYSAVLPRYRWQAQGNCFQRQSPLSQRTNVLCMQASAGQIALTITEQ
jgi:hypothetical protein